MPSFLQGASTCAILAMLIFSSHNSFAEEEVGLGTGFSTEVTGESFRKKPAEHEAAKAENKESKVKPGLGSDFSTDVKPQYGSEQLQELYKKRKLFTSRSYKEVRAISAERFRQTNAELLQEQLSTTTQTWLAEHTETAENLFTAIDGQHDDVARVLDLFDQLCTKSTEQVAEHADLAIAVALVWDKPRGAVYTYAHHQKRAKAEMPTGLVGPLENFQHLVGSSGGRFLPWEFLVYAVNHPTPMKERTWAVENYAHRTGNFGKSYQDVPYDQTMLKSGSEVAKLNGHSYDLPSIRQFGGVCAHQADFASRVGKSLGIPAAYVRGENVFNDYHAWLCWVELTAPPTADRISFALKSSGRYRGDKYYVGQLNDPHTGEQITDREMERQLQTAGLNATAKRQADLVMRAFPELSHSLELSPRDQLLFLSKVTQLCPGNTQAWRDMAKLSVDGKIDDKNTKLMRKQLSVLFNTFRNVPDFTWEVFDDFIAYEKDPKKRLKAYDQLTGVYVAADRPDLASLARLKQADLFLEIEEPIEAAKSLAATTAAVAQDGRYAPLMLARMREIAEPIEGGPEFIDTFWPKYLLAIPPRRGNELSKYFVKMHEEAVKWYSSRENQAAVDQINNRLDAVRRGRG
ncbi:hypothetical protein [Adhaeretor mobilis]|uniref:Secreted protein n=1 Tax=Adhaeretor mobilis TaxID=1930276 RepID=A0A517N347_9BACT|nr:hypothetical protein [Adhaeretor mobilis]QDT01561.1 hypothetical protein HG15A2_49080 [Adhaeretor mobilis]